MRTTTSESSDEYNYRRANTVTPCLKLGKIIVGLNVDQLRWLNSDYTAITKQPVRCFVCPITLRDEEVPLCNGHILGEALKTAVGSKVIQRADVDGHFGGTIEPELAFWLNHQVSSPGELVDSMGNLSVTTAAGQKTEAFFAGPAARQKFQEAQLTDGRGNCLTTVFMREQLPPDTGQVRVQGTKFIHDGAVDGALLRSAYLALFRIMGYSWVFNGGADQVRRTLLRYFEDRASQADTAEYFRGFAGCSQEVMNNPALPDTLPGKAVLFHLADLDGDRESTFAISCIFRVNDRLITVTLPWSNHASLSTAGFKCYQEQLQNRKFRQQVRLARFKKGSWDFSDIPLDLQKSD